MTDTLLLIEDDVAVAETFRIMLTEKGFQTEVANDAITGLQKAYALEPDVILLDVKLPDMDGWQTCSRFREMSDVPIIMFTSLNSVEDMVKGLDLGADDYVVKPVTVNELTARIKALLRRVPRSSIQNRKKSIRKSPIFTCDFLAIDFDRHEVTVDGERVSLTPIEFRLLATMARNRGRMLPHAYLLNEVWGPEYVSEIEYLRLYIRYLRCKIEKDPAKPSLIHNEWGFGYRFG